MSLVVKIYLDAENTYGFAILQKQGGNKMSRSKLKAMIDELMRQYHDEEIDGATYAQRMMDLTTSWQEDDEDEDD